MITDICDKYGVTIEILAQAFPRDRDYAFKEMNIKAEKNELSQEELVNWYKKFGFEEKYESVTKRRKMPESIELIREPK